MTVITTSRARRTVLQLLISSFTPSSVSSCGNHDWRRDVATGATGAAADGRVETAGCVDDVDDIDKSRSDDCNGRRGCDPIGIGEIVR